MLEIRSLNSYYGYSQALFGVDIDLDAGEVVTVLGRNGMGKTTLMRALMGLVTVSAGRIVFRGRDTAGLRPYTIAKLGIAYVPQGREIFANFTVEENLHLGLVGRPGGARGLPASAYRHFPILAERRGQRAGTLSGGEQQQLAIARALVGQPRLLLLDEPSEGIQPSIVMEIAASLKRIAAEEGLTVLLVEQNVEMVLSLAADCAFIENGRVVARHGAAEIGRDAAILHRYLAM